MKIRLILVKLACLCGLCWCAEPSSAQTAPDGMVWIPAGTFAMGSSIWEYQRRSDETQHTVSISSPFYMDQTEITEGLWSSVAYWGLTNGSYTDLPIVWYNGIIPNTVSTTPMNNMSWYDAIKWCNARSVKEGRTPAYRVNGVIFREGTYFLNSFTNVTCDWSANGYRLPTEAEWEYACRAGTTTEFYGGQATYDFYNNNLTLSPLGWYRYNSGTYGPYSVGKKTPNAWGLYDTHGNVWEWCWDWYGAYEPSQTADPKGAQPTPSLLYRVLRGGAWNTTDSACRSASRDGLRANLTYYASGGTVGLRTVLPSSGLDYWRSVIEKQPVQPTYSAGPVKLPSEKNLIVVTHGWQPRWDPVDVAWVEMMTNSIRQYITGHGLMNWSVQAYKWEEKAHTLSPSTALVNGKGEGGSLGKTLAAQGWSHIHLIAHSAGAALIQTASEILKSNAPSTTVHLTFLDAFIGLGGTESAHYGKGADWADSYFSHDLLTSGGIASYTEGPIENARNINVTYLDANKSAVQVFASSTLGGANQYCYQTASSHGWPYEFYQNTIPPNSQTGAGGYGFLLSKEGGGWGTATNQYKARGNTPTILGTPDPTCVGVGSSTTPSYLLETSVNIWSFSGARSTTGDIAPKGNGFQLFSGSPVWYSIFVTLTNTINLISFDAAFVSAAGAQGLLTVYEGTNIIGAIDERVMMAGMHRYSFSLPQTAENETTVFGFRLDPFGTVGSSVTITNVVFGLAGAPDGGSLSFTGVRENGRPVLQLTAPAGFNYTIESSTDLKSWNPFAVLVNTSGSVRFIDSTGTAKARFYRAIAP